MSYQSKSIVIIRATDATYVNIRDAYRGYGPHVVHNAVMLLLGLAGVERAAAVSALKHNAVRSIWGKRKSTPADPLWVQACRCVLFL